MYAEVAKICIKTSCEIMEVKLLVKLECVTGEERVAWALWSWRSWGKPGERHYLSHQPGSSEVVMK